MKEGSEFQVYRGKWLNSKLILSNTKSHIGYSFAHESAYQIERTQTEPELKLIEGFAAPLPLQDLAPKAALEAYKDKGPFDLRKVMDQGLAYILRNGQDYEIKQSNDNLYFGQFVTKNADDEISKPVGVGRHYGKWGIFEGKHSDQSLEREYGNMYWPSGNQYTGWFDENGQPVNGTFVVGGESRVIEPSSLSSWAEDKQLVNFNWADMFIDIFGINATTEILSKYSKPQNPSKDFMKVKSLFAEKPKNGDLAKQWQEAGIFDFEKLLQSQKVEIVESDMP